MNRKRLFGTATGLGLAAMPAKANDESHIYATLDGIPATMSTAAFYVKLRVDK
ncbi:MAG: hypothetical protein U0R19_06865 [Bryobacteraceae bacterium]